jgi:flagellar protein FlbD
MRKAPRSPTSSALPPWTLELFHIRSIVTSQPSISPIDNSFPADERPWKEHHMIELTRLNGSPLAINCDLIKYAEASPDTVLTLITGEKLVVREPCSEVSRRTLDYRAAVLRKAWPEADSALNARSAYSAESSARDHAHSASAD